jgi:hypothetical protein
MRPALAILLFLTLCSCRDEQATQSSLVPTFDSPVEFVPNGFLKAPGGISVDATGDIWISDTYNDRVAAFSASGSQRYSLPLAPLPGPMGLDRSTGDLLTVTDGASVYRIIPATQQILLVAAISSGTVEAASVFDVNTGNLRGRVLTGLVTGDVDGSTAGDLFASCLANGRENYLLRVRNGGASAIAYSAFPPLDTLATGPRFVAAGRGGTVYTAFTLPDNSLFGLTTPFVYFPLDPLRSRPFPGGEDAGSFFNAGGMDLHGLIAVADGETRTIVVFTASPERTLTVLGMPAVAGLIAPAPTDVAIGNDGSIFAAVRDLQDTGNQRGAVIRFPRRQ